MQTRNTRADCKKNLHISDEEKDESYGKVLTSSQIGFPMRGKW